MKLYQVVAKCLESHGVKHVFLVNGGANLWLIRGLCEDSNIKIVPCAEEKSAAYAADAYARITGLGVCMVTSGPGAAGVVSGICASYQDSTPVLFITGNVATFRRGTPLGVRSYGFQELDFVSMIRGVTKSASQLTWPNYALWTIGSAIQSAQEGRKGPVVVDIPDDLQRMEVDYEFLRTNFGYR